MFKPFVWMFEQNNFRTYCKHFLLIYCKFIIISILALSVAYFFMQNSPLVSILLCVLTVLCLIAPILYIFGYYWELTENIINREWDIAGESIYNGKLREVYKIKLPELSTKNFIIRGVASVVAMFMMAIPFILLMTSGAFLSSLSNLSQESLVIIPIFISFFIPALLWNYAARNSIFAVWNVRKAIYIMGNYTGRYFFNTILFIVFNSLFTLLLSLIAIPLQCNFILNNIQNPVTIAAIFVYLTIYYIVNLYVLHVNAYLLGTIAKSGEQ